MIFLRKLTKSSGKSIFWWKLKQYTKACVQNLKNRSLWGNLWCFDVTLWELSWRFTGRQQTGVFSRQAPYLLPVTQPFNALKTACFFGSWHNWPAILCNRTRLESILTLPICVIKPGLVLKLFLFYPLSVHICSVQCKMVDGFGILLFFWR